MADPIFVGMTGIVVTRAKGKVERIPLVIVDEGGMRAFVFPDGFTLGAYDEMTMPVERFAEALVA